MKRTIRMQVELPATKVSLFEARKSVQMVTDGLKFADRKGASYDVKAMHAFTQNLRGAAGVYEFDIIIDNQHISDEDAMMQEFKSSLPATHKIINVQ